MPRGKTADALGLVRNSRIIKQPTAARSKLLPKTNRVVFLLTFLLALFHKFLSSVLALAFLWRPRALRNTVHNCQHAAICGKPVRNLAIVIHVKYGEVGVFARFHAPFAVG